MKSRDDVTWVLLLALLPLLMLWGCADSSTKGDSTQREYTDLVVISDNPGEITLTVNLTASSDQETDTDQDTAGTSVITPKVSLGLQGGTAALADEGANFMMEGISSLFQQWEDKKKYDSDNTTTTDTSHSGTDAPKPDRTPTDTTTEPTDNTTSTVFEFFETDSLEPLGNKSFTWLSWKGGSKEGSVKFVFSGTCGEFIVPDVNKIWGEDGNSDNHNQRFYFPGDHPGQDTNNGYASVFTAPNCVSESVDIYFSTSEDVTDDNDVVQTKFHHTQTNGPDGGQSLVSCPGQVWGFDSCQAGDVNIPLHGDRDEDDREGYWNMNEYSDENITCEKDGKTYTYPADADASRGMVFGSCDDVTDITNLETIFTRTYTNWTEGDWEFGHGGQALMMCLDNDIKFDSCSAGEIDIPYHGTDKSRLTYWNESKYSDNPITCKKDGKSYIYPTTMGAKVTGSCPTG